MDLINRDDLKFEIKYSRARGKSILVETVSEILDSIIRNAPTVDAVPIVRCKDCKHRPEKICEDEPEKGFNLEFPDWRCPCRCDDGYYSWMPDDNWFCGNGEKDEK